MRMRAQSRKTFFERHGGMHAAQECRLATAQPRRAQRGSEGSPQDRPRVHHAAAGPLGARLAPGVQPAARGRRRGPQGWVRHPAADKAVRHPLRPALGPSCQPSLLPPAQPTRTSGAALQPSPVERCRQGGHVQPRLHGPAPHPHKLGVPVEGGGEGGERREDGLASQPQRGCAPAAATTLRRCPARQACRL